MGTIYSIACKECKVTRSLNKFYTAYGIDDREEALKYCEEIEKDSFRAGLLVSFMAEHMEHECVFFNEHSACQEDYWPFYENEFVEDTDFWVEDSKGINSDVDKESES